jgi:farnesyl diphosphate synthase
MISPATIDKSIDFIVTDIPDDDKVLFELLFDRFCDEIIADLPTIYEMPDEAVEWVKNMLQYTVAGGKMNRGLAAMRVQKDFTEASGRKLSDKQRIQSAALGWCIEFLQAFFLVADDIMDGSITRRGQPCWYKRSEVQLIAINDSFILESCVYKILKRYFGKEIYYPQLLDLFIEVTRQTELGQLLDLTSQPMDGPINLKRFTMNRLTSIFKYKTAFYSFYLPVALGMIVSGVTDSKMYDNARDILCIMGEYFQIQDDFLDCYGDIETIGKVGTDIQDAKCSWMVVTALEKCDTKQRKIIEKNYGKHDVKFVNIIKKLYDDLNLRSEFGSYEEESYQLITSKLNESNLPKAGFNYLLKRIYKRKK